MPKNPSPQELETVAQLRIALRRFLFATDQVTERHGLTSRQYDLLSLLNDPGQDHLTASAIAEQLSLSPSATTELVTRASKAGLLERQLDPKDTRIKYVLPTKEGRKRFFAAVHDLRSERAKILGLLRAAAALATLLSTAL